MRTLAEETDELFWKASLSDEDLGYPDDVSFLPADEEWTEEELWRSLREGMATVLVMEDFELLFMPLRRNVLDRLSGRVPVRVAQRADGHATPYATRSRLGRHPLREMRRLALS